MRKLSNLHCTRRRRPPDFLSGLYCRYQSFDGHNPHQMQVLMFGYLSINQGKGKSPCSGERNPKKPHYALAVTPTIFIGIECLCLIVGDCKQELLQISPLLQNYLNRSSRNYRRWSSTYLNWYNTRFLPATFYA